MVGARGDLCLRGARVLPTSASSRKIQAGFQRGHLEQKHEQKKAGYVVGVGSCAVDYLGLIPRLPESSGGAEIAEFSQQGGGVAATALATLAIFGAPARFVGKISDDHFGDFIKAGLDGLGVDTRFMITEPDRVSPFSFSAVEMVEGQRSIYWSRGNLSPLLPQECDEAAVLEGASTLIIDGAQPALQLHLAKAARARGITVVLDASDGGPDTEKLVPFATILVVSERAATDIAPASELEKILQKLKDLGPKVCIMTLGAEGAIGLDAEGRFHEEQAFRVDVKDTTGAGEVFLGAATYALIQQWPFERTMKFANVAAGLACQRLGARAGIPKLELVLEHANFKENDS